MDSTDALSRYIRPTRHDIYIRPARPYCACAALRANVAGRIGNRVSPAESAFVSIFSLHRIGIESDLSPDHLGLQTRGGALSRHLQGS